MNTKVHRIFRFLWASFFRDDDENEYKSKRHYFCVLWNGME